MTHHPAWGGVITPVGSRLTPTVHRCPEGEAVGGSTTTNPQQQHTTMTCGEPRPMMIQQFALRVSRKQFYCFTVLLLLLFIFITYLSFYLFIFLLFYNPVYLFTCLPIYLSSYLPMYQSTCLPIFLFTYLPPFYLSYLFTKLPLYFFTCSSVVGRCRVEASS